MCWLTHIVSAQELLINILGTVQIFKHWFVLDNQHLVHLLLYVAFAFTANKQYGWSWNKWLLSLNIQPQSP